MYSIFASLKSSIRKTTIANDVELIIAEWFLAEFCFVMILSKYILNSTWKSNFNTTIPQLPQLLMEY